MTSSAKIGAYRGTEFWQGPVHPGPTRAARDEGGRADAEGPHPGRWVCPETLAPKSSFAGHWISQKVRSTGVPGAAMETLARRDQRVPDPRDRAAVDEELELLHNIQP